MTDRDLITEALATVRRRWRTRLLLEGLFQVLLLAIAVVGGWTLALQIIGQSGAAIGLVRAVGWVLVLGALVWQLIRVFRRRPDPAQVALYVEERVPDLRQSLISAVEVIEEKDRTRDERQAPPPNLIERVIKAARDGLAAAEFGRRLEFRRIRRAGGWLGALTLGSAAVLLLGPQSLRDSTTSLVNPWRKPPAVQPFTIAVEPGNAEIPKGGAQQVSALLGGFQSDQAELVYRSDSTADWERIPMERDSLAGRFMARLFEVLKPTDYFVEAQGIRSPLYRLKVVDLPAVKGLVATIDLPAYTGLPSETVDPAADLAVLTGSTITIRASTTRPAKGAKLMLDGRPAADMRPAPDGSWVSSFKVKSDGFYRVELTTDDGRTIKGLEYAIDALDDAAPTVRFAAPGRDTKVTSVEEVTAQVEATDDFGLRRLELHLSVNGGAERTVTLADSTVRSLKELSAAHTMFLEEWSLKPGDVVSYYAKAIDGAGHSGSSDMYFLEVRPFDKTYREAEQSGGGGGGGGESAEGLSERQRQIVVGTFNVLRDSAASQRRAWDENVTTLAISQGRLVGEVTNLVTRVRSRGLVQDTLFKTIADQLDSAAIRMRAAEEQLAQRKARPALPDEQRALAHLQRAEAAYREVQVSMGNQQGGGGGSAQATADELADLFELETDKLRNQYESVQRESGAEAERKLDETLERLRRLASRQQQENERMERMANAMRNRQQSGGGGGGGAQRQLAEETEEAARQLERLAREKNSPQMAEQARRLKEAAEQMRRAASNGSEQGSAQGNSALERLKNATRELERSRSQNRQEEVRRLASRAEELRSKQAEVAEQAQSLPQDDTAKAGRVNSLSERKDGLARDVERLGADAERLGRDIAREQPNAARKLGEAADGIKNSRVRDKLVFSKDLLRRGSPEAVRSFEEQIGQNLAEASERLKEAAGSLSDSPGDRQARALDRARDLVRGLNSLEERARASEQNRRGQSGQQQNGQQQGGQQQNGQQQNGQQQNGQQQNGQQQNGQQQGGQQQQQGGQQQGGQQQGGQQQGQQSGGQSDRTQSQSGDPRGQNQTEQPGGVTQGAPNGSPNGRVDPGDPRQYVRELRARRQAAESLRADLRALGQDVRDLDRLVQQLRAFENSEALGTVKGLDRLHEDVIEGLKSYEFALWRKFGDSGEQRPALGASARVPPQYRELVEEYYRALARGGQADRRTGGQKDRDATRERSQPR
jgi:hypothetical protein